MKILFDNKIKNLKSEPTMKQFVDYYKYYAKFIDIQGCEGLTTTISFYKDQQKPKFTITACCAKHQRNAERALSKKGIEDVIASGEKPFQYI